MNFSKKDKFNLKRLVKNCVPIMEHWERMVACTHQKKNQVFKAKIVILFNDFSQN